MISADIELLMKIVIQQSSSHLQPTASTACGEPIFLSTSPENKHVRQKSQWQSFGKGVIAVWQAGIAMAQELCHRSDTRSPVAFAKQIPAL